MLMDKVANSKNDEFYTPLYAVKPIEKYLRKGSTIWCPFDTSESWFVRYLTSCGYTVWSSHLKYGIDFFEQSKPKKVDYIISNPPFSSAYVCSGILPKKIMFEEIQK